MTGPTSRVVIRRTAPEDVGQRQIYVRVDDGPPRTLRHGQDVTFDVAAGSHALKANNTLYWKTLRFDSQPGEEVVFDVVNQAGRTAFSLLALLGVGPLKLVVREADRRMPGPDGLS